VSLICEILRSKKGGAHYGDKVIVNDVGIDVRGEETVGFLRPNGSGKTITQGGKSQSSERCWDSGEATKSACPNHSAPMQSRNHLLWAIDRQCG
jgi:ABC-type multidrug transport system ATPase subunit